MQNNTTESMLILTYQEPEGDQLIRKMPCMIDRIDKNHSTKVIYTSTKLSSQLVLKDQTIKEHKIGLVYKVLCLKKIVAQPSLVLVILVVL